MESIEEQDEQQNRLEEGGLALELAVLLVLVHRLTRIDEDTTYAGARAAETQDMARIAAVSKAAEGFLTKSVTKAMDELVKESEDYAAPYFAARGLENLSIKDDIFTSGLLRKGLEAGTAEVLKACDSTVWQLYTDQGLIPFKQAYRSYVDRAIQALARGEESYYEAVNKTVEQVAKSGLRVQYESGASRELYSAMAQNIMDGYRATMQDIRTEQANRFGADGVAISAHGLCATDHLPYQGREFSITEFNEIQNTLPRPIGKWNCHHHVDGIILGVSSTVYTKKELQKIADSSTRKTGIETRSGKDLTAYEFTQWQRAQETSVRRLKVERKLKAEADLDTARLDQAISTKTDNYYKASAKAKVRPRPERMAVFEIS